MNKSACLYALVVFGTSWGCQAGSTGTSSNEPMAVDQPAGDVHAGGAPARAAGGSFATPAATAPSPAAATTTPAPAPPPMASPAAGAVAPAPANAAPPDHPVASSAVVTNSLPTAVVAQSTYTAAIGAQGLDHPTEGGGIDVRFDPAVVRVTAVTVDKKTWEFYAKDGVIDNVQGQIADILFASFEGRSGDVPIATVSLQAVASGNPRWQLTESKVNPFASAGQHLSVAIQ